MTGWRAYLTVVGIFLAGAVAGAAAMHLYRVRIERSIATSPEPVAQAAVMLLDRELSLSGSQEERIRQELVDARRRFIAAHPSLLVDMKAVFEDAQERIGQTLTPEQKPIFDRIVAERRSLFDRAIAESNSETISGPRP